MWTYYLAILRNPHEAVACNGVHPSLSPRFTSAFLSTRYSTISRLSSIQAWKKNYFFHEIIGKKEYIFINFSRRFVYSIWKVANNQVVETGNQSSKQVIHGLTI